MTFGEATEIRVRIAHGRAPVALVKTERRGPKNYAVTLQVEKIDLDPRQDILETESWESAAQFIGKHEPAG